MMNATLSLKDHLSEAGIVKWLLALSVPNAPVRRAGVKTALRFFAMRMPTLSPQMALNFLLAMDLSQPVREVTLHKGEKVIAFRNPREAEFKLFYTRPGASMYSSGINPHERIVVHFNVTSQVPALETYTTGTIDVWSVPAVAQHTTVAPRAGTYGVLADAGGIQLIIPDAARYLTVVDVAS